MIMIIIIIIILSIDYGEVYQHVTYFKWSSNVMDYHSAENLAENWAKNNCCLLPIYDFANAGELAGKFGIEFKCGLQLLMRIRQSIRDQINGH